MISGALRAAVQYERRSSLENPQTPLNFPAEWLLDIFNGGRTDSGMRVSQITALQVGTVFSCVNIVSDGIASLPFHVYELLKSHEGRYGKKQAREHSLWNTLHNEPNEEMTTPDFLKTLMCHALLWGNGYVEIERDGGAAISALWPRNPAKTRPIRLTQAATIEGDLLPIGTLLYETTDGMRGGLLDQKDLNQGAELATGRPRVILNEDMLHIKGLALDGRLGQSIVWLARQAIGLSLASEKYGAKFFGNGARPAGVLEIPQKLDDEAIENLRKSWAESHGGENAWKTAVLEQGVKYTKIAATPNEGQLLETRKYQREEIAAIFGVPQHMISAVDKSGKSNVEQSSIEFVLYCLNPWIERIQKEFGRKLFPKMGRTANKFFPKFDTHRLMYPDAASRGTFYAAGRQWGFLNGDDICELEDRNPLPNGIGQPYWMPINMQDASNPQKLGAKDQADLETKQAMKQKEQDNEHALNTQKLSQSHELKLAAAGVPPAQQQQQGNEPSQDKGKKKPAQKRSDVTPALEFGDLNENGGIVSVTDTPTQE
jgi:HK97 family phage portal protein